MSFFNGKQSALVLNILNISTSSTSYSVLFTDHLWICRRAQISVEFSWRHLCIVKMEHLFSPSSASRFTDYLSMWRPPYYPTATQLLCWEILLKAFGIPWDPLSIVSASNTQLLLNSKAWSWEAGLAFWKVEPFLMCHNHPRVHWFSIWNNLY